MEPAQGKNRFNVSTDTQYQNQDNYDPSNNTYNYKYNSYTFKVEGVKATDTEDASRKVKAALATAVAQQPTATRVDPSSYYFNCVYSLDFSQFGDEYNGISPVAIVEVSGTDTQDLYAVPKNLNIRK